MFLPPPLGCHHPAVVPGAAELAQLRMAAAVEGQLKAAVALAELAQHSRRDPGAGEGKQPIAGEVPGGTEPSHASILATALSIELARLTSARAACMALVESMPAAAPALQPVVAAAASASQVPSVLQHGRRPKEQAGTLREFLQELRNEDPRRVFVARSINQLGFRSRTVLERHFCRYGEVTHVMVAHSKVKSLRNSLLPRRTRPGNLGLVVMRSPDVVQSILAEGLVHYVGGVQINVHMFDRQKMDQEEGCTSRMNGSGADESTGSASSGNAMSVATWRLSRAEPQGAVHRSQEIPETACVNPDGHWVGPPALLPTVAPRGLSAPGMLPWPPGLGIAPVSWNTNHLVALEHAKQAAALRQLAKQAQQAQQSLKCLEDMCTQNLKALSMSGEQTPFPPPMQGLDLPHISALPGMSHVPANIPNAFSGELSHQNTRQFSGNSSQRSTVTNYGAPGQVFAAEDSEETSFSQRFQTDSASVDSGRSTRSSQHARDMKDTFAWHLAQLQNEDPSCIFVAMGIGKLGFRSRDILRQHCSGFGEVVSVFFAHSKTNPVNSDRPCRTGQGGLAIIVMSTAESVQQILALGETQRVVGHDIHMHPFKRPNKPSSNCSTEATAKAETNSGAVAASRPVANTDDSSSSSSGNGATGLESQSNGRDGDVGSSDGSEGGPGSSP